MNFTRVLVCSHNKIGDKTLMRWLDVGRRDGLD